jgi:hypothetical protein
LLLSNYQVSMLIQWFYYVYKDLIKITHNEKYGFGTITINTSFCLHNRSKSWMWFISSTLNISVHSSNNLPCWALIHQCCIWRSIYLRIPIIRNYKLIKVTQIGNRNSFLLPSS